MKRYLKTIFCLTSLALIVIAGQHSFAQKPKHDDPIPDNLDNIIHKRADLIKHEISDSKNEWSGTYVAGDHHPTVFIWAPNQGFIVTSSLHTFAPSWVNYGGVKLINTRLTLYPELTKENKSAHIISTDFVQIIWDEQHFLIPSNDLLSFAYSVHSKAESQIVGYFVRSEDRDKSRRGFPKLPLEYNKYLKMSPIVTRISGLGREDKYWSSITIPAGRSDGIIEGMTLYHISRSGIHLSVRVTEVSDKSSRAEVSSIAATGSVSSKEIKLIVGWKLTSRLPKSFIELG